MEQQTTLGHPSRTWADLVATERHAEQLRLIVERYRRRSTVNREPGSSLAASTGEVVLFAGPSGTGKTLAAEVIAGELGLDLFKLDVSAAVSKYAGDTDKSLGKLLDAAEAVGSILLFDETDALFGKRSEVNDSHDRYANTENNYLLQRIEDSDALLILATSLPGNIDESAVRGIHVCVNFEMPGEIERQRLSQLAFPVEYSRDDLNLDRLAAALELAGGSIMNSATSAASRAAADGLPVSKRHVAAALRNEYRKTNRTVDESALTAWEMGQRPSCPVDEVGCGPRPSGHH